ncbi:AIR synthase-related protein [Desulfomonile tiedjei]|uniref:Phosphoribosylformylglycinamidine synthase subunit PurL n=1 Tax=Desulfomonile tiedjei (strain ATCC 49306 / DSM 6799 / DCB-1) TaxID=706587 RepID=I4C3J3_DESTA|nr:AIR synthase-related protein [Desulfomonile tiedjei]AFM24134.1 phosphoribosylformylglycinamidine (FGAM) synthase, synthetase domain protein [Desulfomonile tiedjei DSM 6799]
MPHRIEVCLKSNLPDPAGRRTKSRIASDLGLQIEDLRVADEFIIDKDFSRDDLQTLVEEVFRDPVIQDAVIDEPLQIPFDWLIEVGFRPGVTDNVARTAREAVQRTLDVKFQPGEGLYTRKLYFIRCGLNRDDVERIARDLLANDLIQTRTVYGPADNRASITVPKVTSRSEAVVRSLDLNVDDDELIRISREGVLALSLEEMQTIRDYYRNTEFLSRRKSVGLGEEVTDCELEVLAQTWSEHCKHKIFNAVIEYTDSGNTREINSLFRTYIQGSTEEIRKRLGERDFCLSVFKDNAGVIRFDDDWNLVVKVETHNSPSALDPYGGALTGIVGVNRDPFGTGLGARLIFNTDVFCFAPPDYKGTIPPRLLHPRRVFEGVREGVEHGGNKSGIPTVNGAVVFDERYLGKPLVYCGTGGIMPAKINGKPAHVKRANPGDHIIMTGGRIGKDGIHGATFSSEELHEGSPVSAVQIGDPITQKRMTDFLLMARDMDLYTSITDNGAGGLSSSVGEMAREAGGAKMHLDRAPLKYPGLQPWEILLSEAQERMTVAVPPENLDTFLALAEELDVEATDLGEFTNDGFFQVLWEGRIAVLLPLDFLHDGLPPMKLSASWKAPEYPEPDVACPADLTPTLIGLMSRWNICSKERLIRQYDHEVQSGTVVKPLVGISNDGPGDAAVQRPVLDRFRGVAVGCGIAPRYSDLDTYWMMAAVIDEAVRNIVSVGADPDHMAGLDNFCWCDPVRSEKTPDGEYKLAQLVRANQALYDITTEYGIPCISGKDSMKNDYSIGNTKISIPPTVLFTAVGIVPDVRQAVTPDFKSAGDCVYVLGMTRDETGGSEYFASQGIIGNKVPKVHSPESAIRMYRALHAAMRDGLVASCHDLSDGGLGVALAESAFSGGLGASVSLKYVPVENVSRADVALFSESQCRFLISVRSERKPDFEKALRGFPLGLIGEVTAEQKLRIEGFTDNAVIDADIHQLKKAWQSPLGT